MTATAASRRSASPMTRSARARTIFSSAAATSAASIGATRCKPPRAIAGSGAKSYDAWQKLGIRRADGQAFPASGTAQLWLPVAGGPAFLLGPNFYAVRSYNPSMNYALAICHLGDRLLGGGTFAQHSPAANAR